VGFGKACQIARDLMPDESKRLFNLRERLRNGILSQLDDVYINGDLNQRLPNNLNLSFAFVEAESLLMSLHEEIAVSSGSACMSANIEPSYVLKAIGVKEELAHTSIRFGLGRFNTEEEIDYVIQRIVDNVKKLREISPLYEIVRQGGNKKGDPSSQAV
jgi:cysteine desulfurase